MTPETLLRQALEAAGVKAFTGLEQSPTGKEFVLIVRTSSTTDYLDASRSMISRETNLLLQCHAVGGRGAAVDLAERVEAAVEGLYWEDSVQTLRISGSTLLPTYNGYSVASVSVAITLPRAS